MYIVQSATTPAFISGCGTYLILKVSKTRLYRKNSVSAREKILTMKKKCGKLNSA